jgi:hypothetical protein
MSIYFYASAILFIAGGLFLIIGVVFDSFFTGKVSKCNAKTTGVIDEIIEKDISDKNNEIVVRYFPVYTYKVGKKKFTYTSKVGFFHYQVSTGDEVTICYNEKDPQKCYVENEFRKTIFTLLIAAGLLLIAMGLVFMKLCLSMK